MPSKPTPVAEVRTECAKRPFWWIKRSTLLWFAAILTLLIVSRAVLEPTYLLTFDDVNFALSIKKFDPLHDQPQPPGYPLFVALLRLFGMFIPQIEHVFLAVALFGSMLSLVLLWALGDRLIGAPIGLVSAMLLLFHPAFWYAALTNPIRIYLAAGAIAVACCLVRSLSSQRAVLWYSIAAFVFGIAVGFRPDLFFVLLPVMLYTAWKVRLRTLHLLIAAVAFLLPTAVWLSALFASVGGPLAFIKLMSSYWRQQGGSTSPLLGASFRSSMGMAYQAIIWTFAATLSWLWCAPFVPGRGKPVVTREQRHFLLIWLVPGFLFYALVHIGDPDHPLSLIPVTCIAGAVMLAKFANAFAPRWLPLITALAAGLNLFFFLRPTDQTASAASYEALSSLDTSIQQVVESIHSLHNKGPVTAISFAFTPSWRTVSYYFPDVPVLVIESADPQKPWASKWYQGRGSRLPVHGGTILLPGCGAIAWIDPGARPLVEPAGKPLPSIPGLPVTDVQATPNSSYSLRGFRFQTDSRGCAKNPA